ncbi:MAG: PAS domain S-box protein, partial [Acetobacteraceae bacterium]
HLRPGEAASPSRIDLEDQTAAAARWPLREVLDSGQTLFMPELEETVGVIRGGRWPESIPAAMIMPIPGPTGPAGWLVSGISPRLSPDADYREFLEFAAANIGASMTNARAYEEERKRAEALARLAAIVESSDDAIVSKDLDGIIQSWNGGAERLFGYTAEEAIGRSITIIIPEERSGEEPDILARLRLGERIDHFETVRRRKDGELLDVSLTISPVRDRHGHIVGASKIARDITKRKRAEGIQSEQQALLEAIAAGKPLEQCLRQVTAAVHRLQPFARAGVLLADPSGRKVERCFTSDIPSSFGEGVCGLPISEAFIGSSGTAMFRGEPVMCPDIANDDRWSREWRDLCAMHEVAAIRSTPIFGSEGTAIGSLFICFATPHHPDGWDLRVAEVGAHVAAIAIQRDQARQAVALRTAQFESLFSAAPVGLCLVDAALRIREVNPVAVPIFAKVPDPVGRDFEDVMRATWPGEAAAEIIGQFHKTLRSGEAYGPAGPALRWREADQAEYYEWRLDRLLLPDGQYGIVCYFRDISMQVAAGKAIVESEARLRHIIDSAHEYAITSVDGEGRIRSWNAGAERLLGYDESEALGQSGQIFFTPEDVAAGVLEQEITIAREAGRAASERWHVRKDGSRFWGSGVMLPLLSGEPDMFLKIFRDRTERRQADRRQQMLIHELNHRVKNTLATIQAIVRQTFRGEHSGKEAEAALEARLMTLARCHDLLAREHWEGADLGELTRETLKPFAAAGGVPERFSIEGEPVRLSPQASQSLAMGIHELATNALRYGSLSVPGGKVSVHWKIEAWKGEDLVRFTWEERDGPPVTAPGRKGYGTRLIERILAFEMGGSAKLDYRESGVRCEVRVPCRTQIAPG